MSGMWRSARSFVVKRVLHANDTPHRIALGVGLATFVGFTPTMGLQTAIALGLAALFRANKAVCIPIVWVTNPFTFVPIYGACWWLGAMILPGGDPAVGQAAVLDKLATSTSGSGFFANLFNAEFWSGLFSLMLELGGELWLGCIIVGVVSGLTMYFLTRWGVTTYRVKHEAHLKRKQERREQRRAARKANPHRKMIAPAGEPTSL
ncbi:MAG: hypothetical protein DHS20C16_14160 [Phycisphaerae bacterium]|nr:MAG: hypothetical protein DHS20C16_14160 [Phycisphaerae bacterium]